MRRSSSARWQSPQTAVHEIAGDGDAPVREGGGFRRLLHPVGHAGGRRRSALPRGPAGGGATALQRSGSGHVDACRDAPCTTQAVPRSNRTWAPIGLRVVPEQPLCEEHRQGTEKVGELRRAVRSPKGGVEVRHLAVPVRHREERRQVYAPEVTDVDGSGPPVIEREAPARPRSPGPRSRARSSCGLPRWAAGGSTGPAGEPRTRPGPRGRGGRPPPRRLPPWTRPPGRPRRDPTRWDPTDRSRRGAARGATPGRRTPRSAGGSCARRGAPRSA